MSEGAAAGRPSAAGRCDYYLGGTAHSAADRAAGEKLREFQQRAVRRGVRQPLDLAVSDCDGFRWPDPAVAARKELQGGG